MIIEEDIYIQHHGVKGMKWGVRKKRTSSGSSGSEKKGMSSRKKKALVGTGVALGVGAIAAAAVIRAHGRVKANDAAASKFSRSIKQMEWDQTVLGVKIRQINKAEASGKITPTQAHRLSQLKYRDYIKKHEKTKAGLFGG